MVGNYDAIKNVTNGYSNSRLEANYLMLKAKLITLGHFDILSNGFKARYTDNIM
jgi:hypothetical protein